MNKLMKTITHYIKEGLRINKSSSKNIVDYAYYPKNRDELITILEERLEEDPDADLNDIDVSKITDMNNLFKGLDPHNIDISKWNMSNVKILYGMFENCEYFDCDLSGWDVSNVESMTFMFYNCKKFKGKGLENWDVSKVEYMHAMFEWCESFNCDLSNWDVSKVDDMGFMFKGCESFTGDGLKKWNPKSLWESTQILAGCNLIKKSNIPTWCLNVM